MSTFAEIGRERDDGAVSGTVWRPVSPGRCIKAGSFRVFCGKVVRWTGSTAAQRAEAEARGAAEAIRRGVRIVKVGAQ